MAEIDGSWEWICPSRSSIMWVSMIRIHIRYTEDCRTIRTGSAIANIRAASVLRAGKACSEAMVFTHSPIPLIRIMFMQKHRADRSHESTGRRWLHGIFNRQHVTTRSCVSTGTRRCTSAQMKKAPCILARNSSSARAITARHGSAFRPISPRTIHKSRSRSNPAESLWIIPTRKCTQPFIPSANLLKIRIWSGLERTTAISKSRVMAPGHGTTWRAM